MTLPRWDDEMKFELLRLKSELKPENFRVLHSPLGLGVVKPAPILIRTAKDDSKAQSRVSARAMEAIASIPSLPSLPRSPKSKSPLGRSLTKVLIIHSLDVLFVLMTLSLGVLLASWLIDPGHISDNPDLLKHATPIRFVMQTHALMLVAGLYGFFSLYWLFFKLVTGSTLGESFLDNFWSLQNPRSAASVKDSGDS